MIATRFIKAYNVALAANFISGIISVVLGALGPQMLRIIPPAALLVPVAGERPTSRFCWWLTVRACHFSRTTRARVLFLQSPNLHPRLFNCVCNGRDPLRPPLTFRFIKNLKCNLSCAAAATFIV